MKLNKYKIGIIGSGNISDFHINVLKSHKNIQINLLDCYSRFKLKLSSRTFQSPGPKFHQEGKTSWDQFLD